MKDFSKLGALQAVMYTVKMVVSKKQCKIDTLLLHTTNRKYNMAYLFVPFPMTLDDIEGHSPNAGLIKCNSTNICATYLVSINTARRAVPRRQLSLLSNLTAGVNEVSLPMTIIRRSV